MSTLSVSGPLDDGDDREESDGAKSANSGSSDAAGEPRQGRAAGAGQRRDDARSSANSRRRNQHIPSPEAILATLAQIASMVALGVFTPGQANAMTRALGLLLASTGDSAQRRASGAVDAASLREALKTNPNVLNAIAPLLSDAELQDLLDDDETA